MENINKQFLNLPFYFLLWNNAMLFFPYPSISMCASFTGPFVIVGLYNW
uniref:Uncharacterized protein n=1 Tax=Wuchereria bancrofti TaxID=6293 RepID=A0AAF5PU12_WUCBA